ncbi:hypothetical protein GCM10009555_015580 [Acrocarpospora macrocephala]|uniref:Uncharacterized protein n=1 Tax=Acrocarpospora macrocephala TaxID=150177 RepID=A0A5M3X296_9ACTN|nr:hypothetical protein Amac_077960 [Acrocarpospora macrocephala]
MLDRFNTCHQFREGLARDPRSEVEAVKHFVLDLQEDVPVIVDYVVELSGSSAGEFVLISCSRAVSCSVAYGV